MKSKNFDKEKGWKTSQMDLYDGWAKRPKIKPLSPFWKFYGNFEGEVEITFLDEVAGKMALDMGCRDARFVSQLISKKANVIGIDLSINCIKLAQQKIAKYGKDKADFIVCDAEKLPFRQGIFDYVTILFLLHHLSNFHVLGEAQYVLKQTGTLLLNEPVRNNFIVVLGSKIYPLLFPSIRAKMLQDPEDNPKHTKERSIFSISKIEKALHVAKFSIIMKEGQHLFLFPLEHLIRLLPALRFIFTDQILFSLYHIEKKMLKKGFGNSGRYIIIKCKKQDLYT